MVSGPVVQGGGRRSPDRNLARHHAVVQVSGSRPSAGRPASSEVHDRPRRVRTFGLFFALLRPPPLALGRRGRLLLRGQLSRASMAVESRERWPTSPVRLPSASCTRWGNCVAALGEGARGPTRSLPSRRPVDTSVSNRSSHAVDRLGHEGPRHRRAILGGRPGISTGDRCSRMTSSGCTSSRSVAPTRGPTVETAHAGSTASRRRRRRALNSWLVDRSWNLPADLPPRSMSSSESMARGDPMLAYAKQYDALKAELQTLGFLCQGSQTRRVACGKTTCRCHRDPDARHGPYHYWTRKARGAPHSSLRACWSREVP